MPTYPGRMLRHAENVRPSKIKPTIPTRTSLTTLVRGFGEGRSGFIGFYLSGFATAQSYCFGRSYSAAEKVRCADRECVSVPMELIAAQAARRSKEARSRLRSLGGWVS